MGGRGLIVDRGRPWLREDLGDGRLKALEHPLRDLLQALAAGARCAPSRASGRQDPSEVEHKRAHQRIECDPLQLGVGAGVVL
jgi:hypothetical protein